MIEPIKGEDMIAGQWPKEELDGTAIMNKLNEAIAEINALRKDVDYCKARFSTNTPPPIRNTTVHCLHCGKPFVTGVVVIEKESHD